MPEHPRATRTRQLFHALWDEGDLEAPLATLASDVVWVNDIGAGPLRELRGRDQVRAMELWAIPFLPPPLRQPHVERCRKNRLTGRVGWRFG